MNGVVTRPGRANLPPQDGTLMPAEPMPAAADAELDKQRQQCAAILRRGPAEASAGIIVNVLAESADISAAVIGYLVEARRDDLVTALGEWGGGQQDYGQDDGAAP